MANPSFPVSNQDFVGYRQRSRFRCPVPQLDTSQIEPIGTAAVLGNPLPTYSLPRFYSMVISLRVLALNIMRTRAHLMSKDGMLCGSVSLDGFNQTGLPYPNSLVEFVLLSSRKINLIPLFVGFKSDGRLYNVMMVGYNNGLAERWGVGTISKGAVHQCFEPGPVWKEIVLG
jgi:hypothetical protein